MRRKEKLREQSRARSRQIQEMVADGKNATQIGIALGVSKNRVLEIARYHGVVLARPHTRRFAFYCPRRRVDVIMQLADGAGVSPSVMVDRIVASVVGDGIDRARKFLGKLALPSQAHDGGGTDV